MLKTFLESRLEKWKRLEELTTRVSRYRLTHLSGEELREFGRLYRRTAADLAIAREDVRDQRLVNYLNYLVGRAHGAIYRSESSGFGAIWSFYRYDLPAIFRKNFVYILVSFLIFAAPAIAGFALGYVDNGFADRVAPDLKQKVVAHENWTKEINKSNPVASSSIQTNNIQVTFLAFAGGVLAGVGTFYVLAFNGLHFGLVMGLCFRYRFWELPVFVTGHGVIELSAIFISGGAGLLIGKALLMPGDLRRIDALVTNGMIAIKLILVCIPMLVVAGTIEGFISPQPISPYYKFAVSLLSGLVMAVYFLKPDKRRMEKGPSSELRVPSVEG